MYFLFRQLVLAVLHVRRRVVEVTYRGRKRSFYVEGTSKRGALSKARDLRKQGLRARALTDQTVKEPVKPEVQEKLEKANEEVKEAVEETKEAKEAVKELKEKLD